MATLGDRLFNQVQEYSDLGFHRTGTPVDVATIEWFERQLLDMGARVERAPYRFPRYDAEWSLTVDGRELKSHPLYYEAVGNFDVTSPFVGTINISGSQPTVDEIERLKQKALKSGADGMVIGTTGRNGHVVVPNREPVLGGGFPTILAAGVFLERLQQGDVHMALDAEITEAESANVIGRIGDGDFTRPVVVTTPLSGWFNCAGERGTGIAIALELAKSLAQNYPVIVIGATGHELENFGAKKHLETISEKPAAIIHMGASVAAAARGADGSLVISPTRHARTSATGEVAQDIEQALVPGQFAFESNPPLYMGEGAEWARLGAPLLSFAGPFPLFHTPEDVPENATSPEIMQVVCDAVIEASHIFVANALEG